MKKYLLKSLFNISIIDRETVKKYLVLNSRIINLNYKLFVPIQKNTTSVML